VHPVTLGVLLDGRIQEGWILESLKQALAVPGARLAAVAVAHGIVRESFASSLHRLFDLLDERLRCRGERLFIRTDVASEFGVPLLEIGVARHNDGWCPDEAGVAGLRQCAVDIWLCFTALPPRRPMCRVSSLGTWGVEIGQGVSAVSNWSGAMELGAGSPVTMVSVVDYAKSGDGVLYRTFGATVTNSVRRNRLSALRKGVSFFRRMLEHPTRNGDARRPVGSAAPAPARYPTLREPTVSAVARVCWRLASNVAANRCIH
jgi:hypothetical protein